MRFIEQYDKVFKNDIVINCGREECKKLIHLADIVGKDFCTDYGNEHNGMMNIENIQELKSYLLLYL